MTVKIGVETTPMWWPQTGYLPTQVITAREPFWTSIRHQTSTSTTMHSSSKHHLKTITIKRISKHKVFLLAIDRSFKASVKAIEIINTITRAWAKTVTLSAAETKLWVQTVKLLTKTMCLKGQLSLKCARCPLVATKSLPIVSELRGEPALRVKPVGIMLSMRLTTKVAVTW